MSRHSWLFLGVLLAGCGGPSIHQDYDPKEDFSKFKTWAWAPTQPQASGPSDPMAVSTLTQERLHRSVERELTAKGLSQVDANSADFWVQHYAVVEQQIVVDPGYDWGTNDVSSYDKGTIIVDLVTPKTKRLVWRGTASDVVDPDLTPNERETRIQEAVHEILEQFPPKK
jgi:hypothetical protein